MFAGDIYISPYVQENYNVSGITGIVSERLLSEMANADIVMVNEEFPFSLGGVKAPDKQFNFRVDPLYTHQICSRINIFSGKLFLIILRRIGFFNAPMIWG